MKIFFGLAGKADDKRRAQRNSRDAGADSLQQIHDVLPGGLAAHALEHAPMDVLERDVDIPRHFRTLGNGLNQLVRPMRWMGIQQANPEPARQPIQLAQQCADRR